MTQKTYWSKTSIVATLIVVVMIVVAATGMYLFEPGLLFASIIMLVVLASTCAVALFFMPTEVGIEDGALTVTFPCRFRKFPLAEIVEAAPFTEARRMWRTCGSGAFFGWWGWFTAQGVGKFMMYASNLDQLLLIRLANGKKYVISCADVPGMIAAMRQAHCE